jgi:hypothetical protein
VSVSPNEDSKRPWDDEKTYGITDLTTLEPPQSVFLPTYAGTRPEKGLSVYSDPTRATIKLSSTPSVAEGDLSRFRADEKSKRKVSVSSTYTGISVSTVGKSSLRQPPVPSPPGITSRPLVPTPAVIVSERIPLRNVSPSGSLNRGRPGLPSNPKPISRPAGNFF